MNNADDTPIADAKPSRGMAAFSADSDSNAFDASEWPFFWLTHATGLYLSKLEKELKKIGLDIGRWRVLMCVHPDSPRGISEIADLAIVKLPTMMKLIQRMEAEGLVTSESRASDGRYTDVSLTSAGLVAKQRAWRTASKIFARAFSEGDESRLSQLNELLRQIVMRLESN